VPGTGRLHPRRAVVYAANLTGPCGKSKGRRSSGLQLVVELAQRGPELFQLGVSLGVSMLLSESSRGLYDTMIRPVLALESRNEELRDAVRLAPLAAEECVAADADRPPPHTGRVPSAGRRAVALIGAAVQDAPTEAALPCAHGRNEIKARTPIRFRNAIFAGPRRSRFYRCER
jgi:hypothetical protein